MFSSYTLGVLLGTVLLISSIPDAASYSKYGRTCKDIGCRSDEVCVMAEDPCSIYQRDNCGRYPTCTKSRPGGASCASTVCGDNEYCKTENGMPKCVRKSDAIAYPTRRPGKKRPAPATPSSRIGGRASGNSGSRNSIGTGSIFNRLFGNDRDQASATTPKSRGQQAASGYYDTHTSTDRQGNRVWKFSELKLCIILCLLKVRPKYGKSLMSGSVSILDGNDCISSEKIDKRLMRNAKTQLNPLNSTLPTTIKYVKTKYKKKIYKAQAFNHPPQVFTSSTQDLTNSTPPKAHNFDQKPKPKNPQNACQNSSFYTQSLNAIKNLTKIQDLTKSSQNPAFRRKSKIQNLLKMHAKTKHTKRLRTAREQHRSWTLHDNELFAEFEDPEKTLVRRQTELEDQQSTKTSSSGYPTGSGYPNSDSTKGTRPSSDSGSSGYPSNNPRSPGSSNYPSYPSSSSSYPGQSSSSGYPSYPSSSSGYPIPSSSSGYPGYPSSSGSNYPSGSIGYPSSSNSRGYPSSSSSGATGYPSSSNSRGYPSSSGSNYPSGSSGYPGSSGSRYPSSSGYPAGAMDEQTVQRVDANSVNAGRPGFSGQGPPGRSSYPGQSAGYPSQYPGGYYGGYPGQGSYPQGYQQGYPQGGYQQSYPAYPGGYYQQPPTTRKPNFGDQLTNIAKDLAGKYLTQTILDRVAGKH
ncbi:uncharacterized protein LOC143431746 [Xylocopa sonorina]|uniref:uncharacterized protein LOC143431746 n=1 Tax=Xylocopa sonorina TaxID=1818115 RepID=UPI00403AAFDC